MSEDFDIWLEGAPVADIDGSDEFDIWLEGAPVLQADMTTTPAVIRRRTMIYFVE